MATFPTREPDIVALAQSIIQGLADHADQFPKSPYGNQELQGSLEAFFGLRDALTRSQAKVTENLTAKNAGLEELTDRMKAVLRYIEHAAENEEQLAYFGWSGRRAPTPLQPPGQCRALEAPRKGPSWVFLDWKEPTEGGKPSYYSIEVSELPDGDWKPAGTSVESEITLANQPAGKSLEYRVFAVNKAGNGVISNVVDVVV